MLLLLPCSGAEYTTHCISVSAQPICGCNKRKMSPTSRDSHKAMCFTSLSWRKHPRVMTTSVCPATTTKPIKRRWLTSQRNTHKCSERLQSHSCWSRKREHRLVTPTAEVCPLKPQPFFSKHQSFDYVRLKFVEGLED